jgi:hypothetical protein
VYFLNECSLNLEEIKVSIAQLKDLEQIVSPTAPTVGADTLRYAELGRLEEQYTRVKATAKKSEKILYDMLPGPN